MAWIPAAISAAVSIGSAIFGQSEKNAARPGETPDLFAPGQSLPLYNYNTTYLNQLIAGLTGNARNERAPADFRINVGNQSIPMNLQAIRMNQWLKPAQTAADIIGRGLGSARGASSGSSDSGMGNLLMALYGSKAFDNLGSSMGSLFGSGSSSGGEWDQSATDFANWFAASE